MRYSFGEFTLDTARFDLCRSGTPVRVEPQVIELLALLVEHSDRMVSKDEINETVWRGRVVSESALSSRIKMARQLLDDDGHRQRFILTVHKRGFRFVHPVERLDDATPHRRTGDRAPVPATLALPAADPAGGLARERDTHVGSVKAATKPVVIVLPFVNLSDIPGQDYFADGVTADIIGRLCKHRWLDVVARNTSFGYRGRAVDARQLRSDLGVDYAVEGSVQRAGDRVRVSVQMSDCRSGHVRWSEVYDRSLIDIFDLQDDVTASVAARLEPEIGFAERHRVVHARPADLQAWDCCHLGIHHLFRFTGPDNREAQQLLRRALELDPLLGDAHAWWAYAVILGMVYWDTEPTPAGLDEALWACEAAMAIDPHNATFHALRARTRLARREYDLAIADNQTAIALNPSLASAYCGLGDSLAYEGRYDEAIARFDEAIAMSPNDPQMWAFLTYGALVLIFKQDYAGALKWADRANALPNRQYWTTAHRAVAQAYLGRSDEACGTVEALLREMPRFSCNFARHKLFYLKRVGQIEMYLQGLREAGVPEV